MLAMSTDTHGLVLGHNWRWNIMDLYMLFIFCV